MTVIFLPLSFVTSYLGMNTSDIRDMDNKQSLFWEIAIPLTVGIMATMLAIAYNGDDIRDYADWLYGALTGKQDRRLSARGISVLQRKRAVTSPADPGTTLSVADDAEYIAPRLRPDYDAWHTNAWERRPAPNVTVYNTTQLDEWEPQPRHVRSSHRHVRRQEPQPEAVPYSYAEPISAPPPEPDQPRPRHAFVHRPGTTPLHASYTPRYDPPPPAPQDRPTYTRIHKRHVVASVLDDAYLPWSYDESDPDYIIVRRELPKYETEMLFQRSRAVKEGRGRGRGGRGYIWTSKKEGRRSNRMARRDYGERDEWD